MHKDLSRRTLLAGAAAAVAAPMINTATFAAPLSSTGRRYDRRVVDLVRESMIVDMLGPLSILSAPEDWSGRATPKFAADIRHAGITAFHSAVGLGGTDAYASALRYFLSWGGYVGRNDDLFLLVDKADDLDRAKRTGKAAVILGLQNSDHFRAVDDVKSFYQLGQRCSQLTYNSQNRLGSGSTDRVDGGVSDYGQAIIGAMNDVGMLVDVSHSGDRTTLDGIALSKVAIAFTHSNCRALSGHPRTKTDEAIKALGAKGGVMGITGVRMFVKAAEPTGIGDVVDHIDHVVKLIGIEHVGIGTDADLYGYDQLPPAAIAAIKANYKSSYAFRDKIDIEAFSGPDKMYNLVEELVRRSYSNENVRAVLGGNFRRLLGETWK